MHVSLYFNLKCTYNERYFVRNLQVVQSEYVQITNYYAWLDDPTDYLSKYALIWRLE